MKKMTIKEKREQVEKEDRLRKIRKMMLVTFVCAVSIISIAFCSYIIYNGGKPAFGDTMKCVPSDGFIFDDLSEFINSVFSEVKTKSSTGKFSFWSKRIPPELRDVWGTNLRKIEDVSSLSINKILIDSEHKGVYHVKCEADPSIEFRLQCAEVNGKYVLLALE